jgi:hypothetical protein
MEPAKSDSENTTRPLNADEKVELGISLLYRLLIGLFLISLGAATMFSFFGQLRGTSAATLLEWVVSFAMAAIFGIAPIAIGCLLMFRALPKK